MACLKTFLLTVDFTRGEDFVLRAVELLKKQDIEVTEHLAGADPDFWEWEDALSGGMKDFFKKAAKKHAEQFPVVQVAPPAGAAVAGLGQLDLQQAFLKVLGQRSLKQQLDEFDMAKEMHRTGLAAFFPVDCWPPLNAVRELVTIRRKDNKPFVCSDLGKFLPNYVPDFIPVTLEPESEHSRSKDKAKVKMLEFTKWQMVWQGYAIASALVGQLHFADSMRYRRTVEQVAMEAAAESRSVFLAVLYDNHVRKGWRKGNRFCRMSLTLLLWLAKSTSRSCVWPRGILICYSPLLPVALSEFFTARLNLCLSRELRRQLLTPPRARRPRLSATNAARLAIMRISAPIQRRRNCLDYLWLRVQLVRFSNQL
jgi:hypothetical protein